MADGTKITPTSSHWGNNLVEVKDDELVAIHSYDADTNPTPIGQSLLEAKDPNTRIAQPMVRKGYLRDKQNSDGSMRGKEPFVAVSWDEARDLAAEALDTTRKKHGNEAIYGGSYGWASAGRFHHAQSQVHRFLNTIGGYTYSVTSYSAGAAEVIIPHILGMPFFQVMFEAPTVKDMVQHTRLAVCFGGIAMKNTQINAGGLGAHTAADQVEELRNANIDFVNVSPIRDDMSDTLNAEWWPCRPNSDVAIMLAMAHTLETEGLVDTAFLDRYCVGYDKFAPYLLGASDGVAKSAEWAESLSSIKADDIRRIARRMAAERSVVGISWSLQRAEHGEQTYWMATTLAAMVGSHGLPGGGVAYGYGSVHNIGFFGRGALPFKVGSLPQGKNPVKTHIPVSRISDMLLNPGETMDYNGKTIVFPDIKVIYWAGGNPFHHHQDIGRLRHAWAKPETIIVNEPFWTATARHADIVFPCTSSLERNDMSGGIYDNYISPMPKAVSRFEQARDDYDVFSGLAERMGVRDEFTEGRDEMQWIEHLYGITRENADGKGVSLPDFDTFWAGEQIGLREQLTDAVFRMEAFREDPDNNPLKTPSGRIEIFSDTIASFGYDDCIGHPAWYNKSEWLGAVRAHEFPLHLLSNQPKTRLHSQYDHAANSRNGKIKDREIVRMNANDAEARNINSGDVVRIFNDRGACLAAAVIGDTLRESVIELPTGAWYDPEDPNDENSMDVHGNPNVLTRDAGTSKLAQGPTAHSCLVEIELFEGEHPAVKVFGPPPITTN